MVSLVENLYLNKKFNNKLVFWRSNLIITSNLVGKEVSVYNGKDFKNIKILEIMVGYKLGNFIFTRRIGDIHKSKKFKKK